MTDTSQFILNADHPEDVFGDNANASKLIYRKLARKYHPDVGGDEEVFKRLGELYSAAEKAISDGTYGQRKQVTSTVLITTRRHAYSIIKLLHKGKTASVYSATYPDDDGTHDAFIKIVRNPSDGSKLAHEGKVLKNMLSVTETFDVISPYLPRYIEAFGYRHNGKTRQAIAFGHDTNYPVVSLDDVKQAYPDGIDPKDAAWMVRRLLITLGVTHALGWAHTQINPRHILIQPEQRGFVLVDWTKAVAQEHWNPESSGQDIGDGLNSIYNITAARLIPQRLRRWFEGCQRYPKRIPDALTLKDEFDELIEDLWGPRTFKPFYMPTNKGA